MARYYIRFKTKLWLLTAIFFLSVIGAIAATVQASETGYTLSDNVFIVIITILTTLLGGVTGILLKIAWNLSGKINLYFEQNDKDKNQICRDVDGVRYEVAAVKAEQVHMGNALYRQNETVTEHIRKIERMEEQVHTLQK